jgi:hypothetical protein
MFPAILREQPVNTLNFISSDSAKFHGGLSSGGAPLFRRGQLMVSGCLTEANAES